jgi:acid phosphatase
MTPRSIRARCLLAVAAALLVRCGADEAEGEALSFLTIGDWGASNPEIGTLVARATAAVADALDPPPSFVLALGDNFYEHGVASAADPQWDSTWRDLWLAASPRLRVPWLAVLGNHDYGHGAAGAAAQVARTTVGDDDQWTMPGDVYTRTFRGGTVAVVCFDAPKLARREYTNTRALYTDADVAAERDALEAALATAAAAPATRWLLVVGHFPVISVGEHHDTPALGELVPLFERYAVDAYFCGHTHTLQHLSQAGTHYVVSGGGSKADGVIRRDAKIAPAGEGDDDPGARKTHFAQARLGFTTHVVRGGRGRTGRTTAAAIVVPNTTTAVEPSAHHRRAQARDDDGEDETAAASDGNDPDLDDDFWKWDDDAFFDDGTPSEGEEHTMDSSFYSLESELLYRYRQHARARTTTVRAPERHDDDGDDEKDGDYWPAGVVWAVLGALGVVGAFSALVASWRPFGRRRYTMIGEKGGARCVVSLGGSAAAAGGRGGIPVVEAAVLNV